MKFRLHDRVKDAQIGIVATVVWISQTFIVVREHTAAQTKIQYLLSELKYLKKVK